MKVKDILSDKGSRVVSIEPQATLREALAIMMENKVGATPVLDAFGKVAGIITERDLTRAVHADVDLDATAVDTRMTLDVVFAGPDDDVEQVMASMTEGRFRHVPVMDNDRLVGIVSIGDMVKSQLDHVKQQFEDLRNYVAGASA